MKQIRSLWGLEHLSLNDALAKIAAEGFTGVEGSLSDIRSTNPDPFLFKIKELGLVYVIGIYTSYDDYITHEYKTVDQHISQCIQQITTALSFNPLPAHMNIHAGSDAFTDKDCNDFFNGIKEVVLNSPVPISFETHRGRIFYNPFQTFRIFQEFSWVNLTLDLSHWVLVCERVFKYEMDIETNDFDNTMMNAFIKRTTHVHARCGTAQASQISGFIENAFEVEYFEGVWNDIFRKNTNVMFTIEYGPKPYLCGVQKLDGFIAEQRKRLDSFK